MTPRSGNAVSKSVKQKDVFDSHKNEALCSWSKRRKTQLGFGKKDKSLNIFK